MKKNNSKTAGRKYKIYMPKKGQNPEEFSKRIEMLSQKIEKNERLAEMKEHALFEYITLMTNFASHDLKKCNSQFRWLYQHFRHQQCKRR